jgi:hypothetical protein
VNFIVFTSRSGRTRQFLLGRGGLVAGATAAILTVFTVGVFAGRHLGPAPEAAVIDALRGEIAGYEAELDLVRADARRNVDALAVRMGQLSAHITRLDALGQRLVGMAGLEDGEFNFGEAPPQGGPDSTEEGLALESGEITRLLDDLQMQIEDRSRQLDVLEALMMNRRLSSEVRPEGRPVSSGWMSSVYGYRTDPFTGRRDFHPGVDFAGKAGSDVLAVASGVVTWSGKRYNYGHMIEIDHGNGLVTRYGHNQENLVAVGEKVKKGQVIAKMGSSGRSTGPHVHLEVLQDGRKVNPLKYVR